MKLSTAKNIKVGDIVTVKYLGGEYKITQIDESRTTDKIIHFWSYNQTFNNKDIDKIVLHF